jgi:hypothetical protein
MDPAARLRFTGCMMIERNTSAVPNGHHQFAARAGWLPLSEDTLVVVQADWNGWRTATARVADLEDVRWLQPAGAPRPLIHASIDCSKLVSGHMSHECHAESAPHSLTVCVLKCHTAPRVYEELTRRARG